MKKQYFKNFRKEGLPGGPNEITINSEGFILSENGQWEFPGLPTVIPSSDITMQGVPYPVLGISDTGDTQMMYPEEDYQFDGDMVYELPMAQKGYNVKPRKGSILLEGETEPSTHLMRREYIPNTGWVAFPSLFQNEDGTWVDMSKEEDWMNIYDEANRRGEVYNFGENKRKAIKFADKGSWKKDLGIKKQGGGDISIPDLTKPNWLDTLPKAQNGKMLNKERQQLLKEKEFEDFLKKSSVDEQGTLTYVLPEYTVKSPEKKLYDEAYNKSIAQQQAFQNSWYPGSTDSDNLGYAPGVMDNIKQRATVKANDFVAKNLVNNNKIGDLKDYQKDYIATSNYSGKLRPNIGKQFTEGVQDLGRITQGKLPTSKSLGILSPLEYPVNLVRGTVKGEGVDALKGNISSPWLDANDVDPGAVNDVGVYNTMTDLALDPLNLSGTGALLGRTGVKYLNKALKTSKESGVLSNAWKLNPKALKEKDMDFLWRWQADQNPEFLSSAGDYVAPADEYTGRWFQLGKPSDIQSYLKMRPGSGTLKGIALRKGVATLPEDAAMFTGSEELKNVERILPQEYLNETTNFRIERNPWENQNYRVEDFGDRLDEAREIFRNASIKPDWLRGYKEVPKNLPSNISPVQSGFPNPLDINRIFNAIKGTKTVANEIMGEFLKGPTNRKAIKEGNNWLDNWIKHPTTQQKIDADMTPLSTNDYIYAPGHIQAKKFKPNSKEYPLLKQIDQNLQQYLGNKNIDPIHEGNWGVSYTHIYDPYTQNLISNGALQTPERFGSWISRSPSMDYNKRLSTTIHEGTHDWVNSHTLKTSKQKDFILDNINKNIKEDYLTWNQNRGKADEILGKERSYQAYLADPTEVHARIMELRKHFNLTPDIKITEDMAKKMIDDLKSNSPIDKKGFLNVIDNDPKKLANLFNRLWAVPPAIIAGEQIQNQNDNKKQYSKGGWLDKL